MLNNSSRHYVVLAVACIIWGATPAAGKLLTEALSPLLLTGLRFAVISILLFAWLAATGQKKQFILSRKLLGIMLALGFMGVLVHNGLLFLGLHYTTATSMALIESLGPTMTVVLAFFCLGERLTHWGLLGICVSCGGAVLLVTRGEWTAIRDLNLNPGDLIILACEAAWSAYIIIALGVRGRLSTTGVTAWSGLFGSIMCFGLGLLTDTLWMGTVDAVALGCLMYIVLAAGLFAFLAWNWAAEAIGASKAGSFVYLVPLSGAVVGVTVLGEDIGAGQMFGALLIACGVVLTAISKVQRRPDMQAGTIRSRLHIGAPARDL